MVRLFFENTKLPGPVAAVRWCVDKIDLDELKGLGIGKPFMALVIAKKLEDAKDEPDSEETFRIVDFKLAPLDQAMEYLEFRGSGEHRVFGKLVWCRYYPDQRKNGRRLEEIFAGRLNRRSCVTIKHLFEYFEEENLASDKIENGYSDVTVPEGHFAKEPSAWEKWWVNFWYESKPVNQCQFRKRRMLAYTIQPFVVVPYMLIRSLILFVDVLIQMSIGKRGIHYGAVIHPFLYSISDWDIIDDKATSIFVKNSAGQDRNSTFFLAMPAIQIGILVFAYVLWLFASIFFSYVGPIWLWFIVLNILIIAFGISVATGVLDRLFPEETDEQRDVKRYRELELLYSQYQDMVCVGVPLKASVSALPSKRRTFYLKFKDFQRSVCRPFAQ